MHINKNRVFHFLQSIYKHCEIGSVCVLHIYNSFRVNGAGLGWQAAAQLSHRCSVGKAIHLRTAQGIVGHSSEDKVGALQRVSAE